MVGGGKGTVFLIFKEPFDKRQFFKPFCIWSEGSLDVFREKVTIRTILRWSSNKVSAVISPDLRIYLKYILWSLITKIGLDRDSNDGDLTGINFVNFCTSSNQLNFCQNVFTRTNLVKCSSSTCGWAYHTNHAKRHPTLYQTVDFCCRLSYVTTIGDIWPIWDLIWDTFGTEY